MGTETQPDYDVTSVSLGTMITADSALAALERRRVVVGDWAKEIVYQAPFRGVVERRRVALVPAADLAGRGAMLLTYRAAVATAMERGLRPLSVEAALALRLEYQQLESTVVVAMLEPTAGFGGTLLCLQPNGVGLPPRLEGRGMHSVPIPVDYLCAFDWPRV